MTPETNKNRLLFERETKIVFYFRHADWQGNVAMVTDCYGDVEQHVGYYPYGEPWREPTGQTRLFGGKERMRDAGLNDYDFVARRLNSALALWSTPDPLAQDYAGTNPYVFCAANPVRFIDPSGKAWRRSNDIFVWVASELSYDSSGKLKKGLYEQAISFSAEGPNGKFDPKSSFNMGTSIATVYKADGTIEEFDACTYPSDLSKYPTVPAGNYEAKVGKHKNTYTALRVSDVGTKDFSNSSIELGKVNPSDKTKTTANGINIHKPGFKNKTGMTTNGKPISAGCILIDCNKWEKFIKIFNVNKQINNVIGIIINRTKK